MQNNEVTYGSVAAKITGDIEKYLRTFDKEELDLDVLHRFMDGVAMCLEYIVDDIIDEDERFDEWELMAQAFAEMNNKGDSEEEIEELIEEIDEGSTLHMHDETIHSVENIFEGTDYFLLEDPMIFTIEFGGNEIVSYINDTSEEALERSVKSIVDMAKSMSEHSLDDIMDEMEDILYSPYLEYEESECPICTYNDSLSYVGSDVLMEVRISEDDFGDSKVVFSVSGENGFMGSLAEPISFCPKCGEELS